MEDISKTSGDVTEVVFGQPEKKAGATEPDGSVLNRRKEDEVLGATLGGKEENVNLRDIEVSRLPPEQQIRQEEEVKTPPPREPRRNEGHQPRGPRAMTDVSVLAPEGLADQRKDTAGRNRQND